MNSLSSGESDDDPRCPHCRQYIAVVEQIITEMDIVEMKMSRLKEALLKHEWVAIENSHNIREMVEGRLELDPNSISFQESIIQANRFLNLLKLANSDLEKLGRLYNRIDSSEPERDLDP